MKIKLFLIFLTLAFVGCKKCKDCTMITKTTTYPPTSDHPKISTTTFEACGKDLNEVDGTTTTSTSSINGYNVTETSKTKCK